jgi:hypothetical protein
MDSDAGLVRLLESFARNHPPRPDWRLPDFDGIEAVIRVAGSAAYAGFQWICHRQSDELLGRILGIRKLERARYHIVQFVSERKLILQDCAHCPPSTWVILAEHEVPVPTGAPSR